MKNDTIKIRCSVRSNLFKRLGYLAGCNYLEKYDFKPFFEMVTADKVTQYMEQHITTQLTYYEACCEFWLYKMFGWTEYDEEVKSLKGIIEKKYKECGRINELEDDF